MAIDLTCSRVAPAHRGRLLLFLCCLLYLCSAISALAQAPAAPMLWGQSRFNDIIAYSPATTPPLIAASGGLGIINLLNTSGTVVREIYSGQGYINTLAFSSDGMLLASGSQDGTIKLMRVSDGVCLHTLIENSMGYSVNAVAFAPIGSPNAGTLAAGSQDGTVTLWNVSTGAYLQTLVANTNYYGVTSVAFAANGTLAAGSNNGSVVLWQYSNGAYIVLHTLTASPDAVLSVAITSDGTTVAAGTWDSTIFSLECEQRQLAVCPPCSKQHVYWFRRVFGGLHLGWDGAGHRLLG